MKSLRIPPVEGHFEGEPQLVTAQLGVTDRGCVYVTVDGVARVPFWPDGTTVRDTAVRVYEVAVPGVDALTVTKESGDRFEAYGVIDDADGPFVDTEGATSERIANELAFCALDAAPIAFTEATGMKRVES